MDSKRLVEVCENAIFQGTCETSKVCEEILSMDGMSSRKGRHFLNHIGAGVYTYLEVGVWKGSTFLSATYDNMNLEAYAVDNWSEFGGPKQDFLDNLNKYASHLNFSKFVEKSIFDVTPEDVDNIKFDCYFYDGVHTQEAQCNALNIVDLLSDSFIYIVDDYAWPEVKVGCREGIVKGKFRVIKEWELPSVGPNSPEMFWNGMYVGVLEKA
jgi:hypothetical protein